ncbi:protein ACCELERATED CELL DEATH 6-like [Macadamia integrifolia]|uniref:protein ACCELERATED CELL DEATH 6-like n=1 Tax=Macadamia integrifolia TaxID=60698 RepID=UPI001C4F1FC3|nr:protein ACCELERATED CELL DEATH 6-like [Macadamia integrifolia]
MESVPLHLPPSCPHSTDNVTPRPESMPPPVNINLHTISDASSTSESGSFGDMEFQSMPPNLLNNRGRDVDNRSISSSDSFDDDFESESDHIVAARPPTTKPMHPRLHRAVVAGDVQTVSLFERELHLQLNPQKNTVAHIAARLGHHSIFELLSNQCPSLLWKPNANGETSLHLAAWAGQLGIVNFLLDSNLGDVERGDGGAQQLQYLRKKNLKGNTALHEALKNDQEEVARVLVTADPHISYWVNNDGKSPAYLAAEAGHLQLLEHMLGLLDDSHDLRPWKGSTPLHAAIIKRDREVVGLVLRFKPELVLATDAKGRNPLHYAASIGYFDGIIELFKVDTLPAYQADSGGLYPIHLAAISGHIKVIQLLLEGCPDSWKLLDKVSWNILHIAAGIGKENVVKYILKTPALEMLINERDYNGDTPLHLAAMGRHSKVVCVLTRDSRVNMSIMNYSNLTALDIAEQKSITEKNGATLASFRKLLTLTALRIANAPRGQKLDAFHGRYSFLPPTMPPLKPHTGFFNRTIAAQLLLVSTLVAIVTFIAGFTIPGGLNSDGPDRGMATMLTNTKLKAFVICDTIAMYCSILSALSLILAQLADGVLMRSIIAFTLPLLGISLSMMAVAFTTGLYMVTSRLHWLAIAVLIVFIIFLVCTLALLLPLLMPIQSQHRFLRRISYYVLYLLASATRGDSDDDMRRGRAY